MRALFAISLFLIGCGSDHAASTADASGGGGDAPADAALDATPASPLALSCAATGSSTYAPDPCPAPSGADGHADFCFRPQWPGVTSVEVYGGFGQATDWTQPFVTLTDDGSGTFTGGAALANGNYPYMFRVHGTADNLVRDGQYLNDQTNGSFVPPPAGAPVQRSVSQLVVPQPPPALHHLTGVVKYGDVAQPCFSVDLEVGELRDGSMVVSEHYTANFAESAADGSFDFPIADGEVMAVVRYPFDLAGKQAPYPDPASTPALGYARTTQQIAGADLALPALDVTYAESDYSAMSPTGGTGSLPQTFTLTVLPTAQTATIAVIATNIAGNDPAYESKPSTMTSVSWDGTFGNGKQAQAGTTYYWGTWQQGATWNAESLLYPITFD
ncbi:MAG TPA: hypothetical protein VMJ10_01905 [Kofleriaceae bacterium]|nr:hypothetical protein [Kofleriaceae bacterium]